MDRRFSWSFAVVTTALAAAVYLAAQAARHGGLLLALLAAVTAAIGILGFAGLARVIFVTERESRQR